MKLSILMPVKDRTNLLPISLGSVLRGLEELEGIETQILIGDNASTIPLEPAIRAISDLPRIVRHDFDRGIWGNTNALIDHSDGEWIHLMHDDDWLLPGFYTRWRKAIEEEPEAGVVSIGARLWREAEELEQSSPPIFDQSGICDARKLFAHLHDKNRFCVSGMLIARSSFNRVGMFRVDLPHAGDWEMWRRLALAIPWYYCLEQLARARVHKGSATTRYCQDGQVPRDIRRSIETVMSAVPMDSWMAFCAGSRQLAQGMLRDAHAAMSEENWELATITVEEALKIMRLF